VPHRVVGDFGGVGQVRAVKALQYADSHAGEGCPSGWRPNSKTIKANPTGSKEYFAEWAVAAK
jgi:alkyl hydroperoxide reductase subunit AhpC